MMEARAMSMSDKAVCPECGAALPPNAAAGLCPQCALKGALDLGREEAEAAPASAPSPRARLGRRFGDFELLELLGRGGMGVVYKAHQTSLNQDVALKMVLDSKQGSAQAFRRFQLEAEVAARLRHPNIVRIYQIGEEDGEQFFTMELIEGESLSRRVARGAFRVPAEAQTKASMHQMQIRIARFMATVARAVDYAHEQGVLHRDIKPGNIMLDVHDEPHLTDFGLAKLAGNSATAVSDSAGVAGTPAYMAPEQARGERLTRAADIYSLGIVLYELLTGKPPFSAATPLETLRLITDQEPPNPTTTTRGLIDADLATIALKCLEKNPAARYGSAGQLAEDLDRWLRHEPIRARPVGPAARLRRWIRRKPLAAAFVATLVMALVSSLWLLYLVNREKNKQAVLVAQVKESDRANNALLKRTLGMVEENLEGIWGNREKRTMPLNQEEIAALAQLPLVPVTNQAALVRWRMGLITDESPAGRVRQHAKLLSELEARGSRSLGRQVRIEVKLYKFQEDFVADLCAGRIDFGRMGAVRYLHARRTEPALIPLVMPTTFYKVGLLFTRTNSGIRSLADVRGRRVAFGDTNSTVSFWAQVKLAEQGITAANLAGHAFLDSTLDFADEVLELGYSNAVQRIGYLHSHAQVIEGVLDGRYDVGVSLTRAFDIHKARGLVAIPGTEFQSSRNLIVGRPRLEPAFVNAIISAMTSLEGRWLEALPDKSPGYEAVPANAFRESWVDRAPCGEEKASRDGGVW